MCYTKFVSVSIYIGNLCEGWGTVLKLKKSLLAIFFAAMLTLSGCSLMETEDLYSLPQPSKEYLQLQKLIDAEIASGCEYAAPTAGSQRQSVQLTDLDGDGVNEAVAFLRNADLQPLICVYRQTGGEYALEERITGDGSAVGRVEYADLDGDGSCEIIVSWEAASEMQLMTAYSLSNGAASVLFKASCIDFQVGDMNSDGRSDVLALTLEQGGGKVDIYSIAKHKDVLQKTTKLSVSLKTADRFRVAAIANGMPAAFIEGPYVENDSDHLLTDIIVFQDGELKNITLDPATGDSSTKRRGGAYCTDIDGDGSLDVPFTKQESAKSPESNIFDWYTYGADGTSTLCASTCHCYTDGWFLTLPEGWRGKLVVRRVNTVSGEHAVVLAVKNDSGRPTDLLTVYTLTDENRSDRAKLGNRFELLNSGTVIYAAEIEAESGFPTGEDIRQDVKERFHLITTDWITGAL